ncbi:phage baseplate protein [Lachnotalea glycerini]|uniref:Baseplate structural protein Gp10 C-terminal domain-containing protein n=1 Tax=Lachnotalea glycerini TaxID=1763509 RepID=A0A371JCC0_9FIRM|nr:hypothetical protein [Lachnotalea glycerini]RDY30410.1 hypothetical protein CG710_014895 [Lachnotalea glycerini]
MQITGNGLKKPEIQEINIKSFGDNVDILDEHLSNTDIHVNAGKIAEITESDELSQIDITDTNSNMWGKFKKAITVLSEHINQIATETTLGHIKIGSGLQISDGVASVNIATLLDKIYPIGSIYLSINNVSPAEFIGGTWERFAQGRTLIGVDTNNSSYIDSQKIGGSETTTLQAKNMASHTHSFGWTGKPSGSASTSVSLSADGNHYHTSGALTANTTSLTGRIANIMMEGTPGISAYGVFSADVGGKAGHYINGTNGGTNCKDAANFDATHGHSISGNTEWGGSHGHSASAITALSFNNMTILGNTGATGNGEAFSNLQPYITSYMWKRVG